MSLIEDSLSDVSSVPEEEYDEKNDNKFPYKQASKTQSFLPKQKDFIQIKKLFDIQTFWQRKDPSLIDDLEDVLDYIEGVKLTSDVLESHPTEVIKLFEVTQCLLELKDQDAEQAADLEADVQDLEKENKALKEKLESLERENRNMKSDTSARLEKLHKREIEDKENEIAKWRKQYFDKDNLINTITTELESARMKLRDFEGMEMSLTSKIKQLENEVESLYDMEKKIRGRNAEDYSEIEKLEDEIDDLQNEKETLKTELEELTDEHLALKDSLKAAKTLEEELRKIIKSNEREIAERIQVADERNKEIAELRDQLDSIVEKHEQEIANVESTLIEDINRLQKQNESLYAEIQMKSEKIEKITLIHEDEIKKLKIEVGHNDVIMNKIDRNDDDNASPVEEEPDLMHVDTNTTKLKLLLKENERLKESVRDLELLLNEEQGKEPELPKTIQQEISTVSLEEFERMKQMKENFEKNIILMEEELREMEEDLLFTKRKVTAYENGVTGLEVAKREIQYHKEQVLLREKKIERYRDILNILLNNFNLLKIELQKFYDRFKIPISERINIDDMQKDTTSKLLDDLLMEERLRWRSKMGTTNDQLQSQIEDLEKTLNLLKETLDKTNAERDDLNRLLQERTDQLEAAENELELLRDQLSRMPLDSSASDTNYRDLYEALLLDYNDLRGNLQHHDDSALRSDFDTIMRRLHNANEENGALQAENKSLRRKIQMLEDEVSRLKDQLQEAKNIIKDFHNANIHTPEDEDLIQKLTQQLQNARAQIQALGNECDDEKKKHATTKKTLIDQQNQKAQLIRDLDDLKIRLNQSIHDNNALRQEIDSLKRGIGHTPAHGNDNASGAHFSQDALIRAQTENRDLLRQLEECKDEIAMMLEEINRLKDQRESSKLREEEWNSIKERLQFYENLLNSDKSSDRDQHANNTLKQIIAGYNSVINQKEVTLNRCMAELDTLRKELLVAKKRHQDEIDNYKRLIMKNDSKLIETLQKNATSLQNETPVEPGPPVGMALEDVEEIMANKNRSISLLQEEVTSLKNEVSELKKNQDLQTENFKLTRKQLESENTQQEKMIEELRMRLELNRTSSQSTNRPIKETPSKLLKEGQQSQKYQKQLYEERKRNSVLQNKVEELYAKIEALKEKYRNEMNSNSAQELSHLVKKETAEYRSESRHLREQLTQMSKELHEKHEMMDKLQSKNIKYMQELTQTQKQLEKISATASKQKKKCLKLEKELYNLKLGKSGLLNETSTSMLNRKQQPAL